MNQDRLTEGAARKTFHAFLSKYCAEIGAIQEDSVSIGQLIPSSSHFPQLTKFKALDDTYLFSRLLDTLLKTIPPSRIVQLIDLGAGSSIPTIGALLSSMDHSGLHVLAVDDDPEAIEISKRNVDEYGCANQFTFIQEDMLKFLSQCELQPNDVVAANPPYVPVPSHITGSFYHPANGGVDGTKYIEPILSKSMSPGALLAIRWCSLDHPLKIISLIEQYYDVLHAEAHRSPLGRYTGTEALRSHLEGLRESGISIFTTAVEGQREFISVGCILQRR